jgi:hypothetical protein
MLVAAVFILALMPMNECGLCKGEGKLDISSYKVPPVCPICSGHGRIPPLKV